MAWLNYHQAIWDAVDASKLDFVLVDGRFRVACALQLLLRTREKTPLIMVHDFTPREYYHDFWQPCYGGHHRPQRLVRP